MKDRDEAGKFIEGNSGKPKGAVSERARLWNELKDWIIGEGADRFREEIQKLKGRDYIKTYVEILEYFKPKLQRTEAEIDLKTKGPMRITYNGKPEEDLLKDE
jgi:hypothetical protein